MNSDEERALFELYCWSQDMVQRKWIAPDQIASDGSQFDVEIGFDEVVGLSQEKEGEQQLRRFILEWGRPMMEREWGVPMYVVRYMLQAMIGRYSSALVLSWGPQALEISEVEKAVFHKSDKLVRVVGMN